MKLRTKSRELLILYIVSILTIIFIGFSISINFIGGLYRFFDAYTSFPLVKFFNNVIFLWLAGLLLITYRLWRKAAKKQMELENIVSSISPDVLMAVDKDRNIIMCNPAVERMFGYKVDEVINKKADLLFFHAESNSMYHLGGNERDGFYIGSATGIKKNGETIPLEIITGGMSGGAAEVLLLRDVTKRKRAEDSLLASEARLRHIIEKNADGIIIVDKKGIVRFVNPAAVSLFGRKEEELLGQLFGYPIAAGDVTEIEVIQKEEEKCVAEMQVVETEWKGERVYLASLRDITEHKRLLSELEQTRQRQLQLKDKFLSHVSHELRSPLAAIHQYVTILLDGLAGDISSDQREYLGVALKNIDRLRDMIKELLEVTRAEVGKLTVEPQCTSIAELLAETVKTLQGRAAAKGIILSPDIQSDLPLIYADPNRIHQILTNLIDNGIKFTPENGKITVRTKIFDQDHNFICISVADTGSGISYEDTQRIFDRLYQGESTISESRKGLGLGLYICRELVSRNGGRIWVESELGQGSTFFFTLPIFSLTRLVSPIFTYENLMMKGSVALITVEVIPINKHLMAKVDEAVLHEARNVLIRCIHPGLDVLLPKMPHTKSGEIFFIVSCADLRGAEVLIKRIQRQLALCEYLQNASIEHPVSYTIIDIPLKGDEIPIDQHIKDVVRTIEDRIRAVLTEQSRRMT